jgi:hypothetical protein
VIHIQNREWRGAVLVLTSTVLVGVLVWQPIALGATVKTCFGKAATLAGTMRANVLRGTAGDDVIVGLGGADTIQGFGGDDLLCGGGGGDRVYGGEGDDRLSGETGNDFLLGEGGNDSFGGNRGTDTCFQDTGAGGRRGCEWPIRGVFYYPWFPEAWHQGGFDPYTQFHPSSGLYSLDQLAVAKQHVEEMLYANINVGIASWWGQGSKTDKRIPLLMNAAGGTPFKWTIFYEPEGKGNPSASEIRADLEYIKQRYGHRPEFLRRDGRFVVFVWTVDDDCSMAARWKEANTVGAFVVLKLFSGFRDCPAQPNGWHQYAPAGPAHQHLPDSFSISPGFWKIGETNPRLERNLGTFTQNVREMAASRARYQLIATFNEWGEGTAVESATEWETSSSNGAYLDALHAYP